MKFCKNIVECAKKKNKDIDKQLPEFEEWFATHKQSCQANYTGSSPAMETEAAERLFRRSESIGFRYINVISDGDSKSFDHVSSLNIYGDNVQIS